MKKQSLTSLSQNYSKAQRIVLKKLYSVDHHRHETGHVLGYSRKRNFIFCSIQFIIKVKIELIVPNVKSFLYLSQQDKDLDSPLKRNFTPVNSLLPRRGKQNTVFYLFLIGLQYIFFLI